MSTAAEKKRAVTSLLEAVHDSVANYNLGKMPAYTLNKLRKAADTLGARTELDDFMRDTWLMTIRASKKKRKKKA